MSGYTGSTDCWQKCPQSLWNAESLLGQDNFGSSVRLHNGTIPICSQAAQTWAWRELLGSQSLLLNPCRMWQEQKGPLCGGLPLTPAMGEMWEGELFCPHCLPLARSSLVGSSVVMPFRVCSSLSLSLLGSVTKACMILRSIEELQHKPGMVSKTPSEPCKVFPLQESFALLAPFCLFPMTATWLECLQGFWAHLPCLGQRWYYNLLQVAWT